MSALKNGAREIARVTMRGRTFVLARQSLEGPTPFVTWELDDEGNAYHGHYFTSHDSGVADLLVRAF